MLQDFLERLCDELDIALGPKTQRKNVYSFRIADGLEAELVDLKPGFAAKGKLSLCPDKRREELFIHLMRANLLGQGTGECRIGLESNEKTLTLCLGLPYEVNYQGFKEKLEDFINYLIYWREEIAKFEKEQQTVL